MDIKDKKYADNFKVNLFLSNSMDSLLEEMQALRNIDWNNIPDEVKEKINAVSYAMKHAMSASNNCLRELENK